MGRPYPVSFHWSSGSADLAALGIGQMWAARLLPASQQRRFVGAGGRSVPERRKTRQEVASKRFQDRQKEVSRAAEDYANGPVSLPREGEDPWSMLAKRPCRLCSRKPVVLLCSRCGVQTCGACISRQTVAPYRWQCLDCSCSSDESGEQSRLLVACQNEEVASRRAVLPQPDPEDAEGLAVRLPRGCWVIKSATQRWHGGLKSSGRAGRCWVIDPSCRSQLL